MSFPETHDPGDWHRRFAIESNNRAWELSTRERSPAEDREMLDAAHAAHLHWKVAGEELHHFRALMLLAETHAQLGLGPTALAFAREVRDFFTNRETEDWELALTHAIHARAAHAAGDTDEHVAAHRRATEAVAAIQDDADRRIVEATFRSVPEP